MNQVVSYLKRFALSRLGSGFLGVTALAGLVWVLGPSFGLESTVARVAIVVVLYGLVAMAAVVRYLMTHYRGKQLHAELSSQQEMIAGRQLEIELLKEKMSEAITDLRSSELGVGYRGNAALYALPWYMIIGPSAAGKSTLLRNSGLHFPVTNNGDIQVKGFGGTRNCDWWFSDEAIILDTAGRYTTEDDDQDEWHAFLSILRKYRPKLPLNGIVVAVSIVDLLTGDQQGVEWHVKVVRERIAELYQQLGFVVPVYLVFTKCDLLQGFSDFFSDLSDDERQQAWGITFSDNGEGTAAVIQEKLGQLYNQLTAHRIHKLAMERNIKRKYTIYDFPEQFKSAVERLDNFIGLLLRDNPYQETVKFTGVYFTSGTQEGSPIQRLLNNMQSAFGYVGESEQATAEENTKSYFIRQLFGDIVFKNQKSAYRNKKTSNMLRYAKSAAVVGGVGVNAAALMLYSGSLTANTVLLHQGVNKASAAIQTYKAKDKTTIERTNALVDLYQYYHKLDTYRQHVPLHLRMGLYRGNRLLSKLDEVFSTTLPEIFSRPVEQQLKSDLVSYQKQWSTADKNGKRDLRGPYYTTLKAYLMLAYPARIEAAQVSQLLADQWVSSLKQGGQLDYMNQSQMKAFVSHYLEMSHQRTLMGKKSEGLIVVQPGLVAKARAQLYSPTNASNLYALIRSRAASDWQPLNVHELLPSDDAGALISSQPLPSIFTEKAWHEFMQPEIERVVTTASAGDWVIDRPLAELAEVKLPENSSQREAGLSEKLQRELRSEYFADYAQAWFSFLEGVHAARFTSLDDASKQLSVFAKNNGPLAALLQAAADNMAVTEKPNQRVRSTDSIVPELQPAFAKLYSAIEPSAKKGVNPDIEKYLGLVAAAQADLAKLAVSPDVQRDAQQYAVGILSGKNTDAELYQASIAIDNLLLKIDDVRAKRALKNLLLAPNREAWRAILVEGIRNLDRKWHNQVMVEYQDTIQGKFPFERQGQDANITDVSDFLRPKDGILWQFVNSDVAPFLVADRNGWHERRWLGVGAGFSDRFLNNLSQAKRISQALFRQSGGEPHFDFEVYPVPTPGIKEVDLQTNGQSYRYMNGPQEWQQFAWPGQPPNLNTRLVAFTSPSDGQASMEYDGVWGLFHLLANAEQKQQHGSVFQGSWALSASDGRRYAIKLWLRTGRKDNLFADIIAKPFRLPSSLFDGDVAGTV